MHRRILTWTVSGLLLFLGASLPVTAGSRIGNVILEIDSRGRGVTEVTNIGAEPIGYVVEPLSWRVVDGQDVYEPTSQFMAVPPNFRLAPAQTQTVRVGFRNTGPAPVERAYRLAVQEVPPNTGEDGVALVYRHLLAVYIAPTGGAKPPKLEWTLTPDGNDVWRLRVTNVGNRRIGIRDVLVRDADGGLVSVGSDNWSTVLAQTWREMRVPAGLVDRGGVELEVVYASSSETVNVTPNVFPEAR